MSYQNLTALSVHVADYIATVTIDNGPINLLDNVLIKDLYVAGKALRADDAVKVIIFESANPDFFIAHADINMFMSLEEPDGKKPSMIQHINELYQHMPKATIAKINGVIRGGGSEFVLALDMRFAGLETTKIGQPEAALGIIAAGGGTLRLPRLIGRGRAMEVLLGAEDFDATLAERYGYINRAIPCEQLDDFVLQLATKIARYPAEAITQTKQMVNLSDTLSPLDLAKEFHSFYQAASAQGMQDRMIRGLELGLQTANAEKEDLDEIIQQL